MITKENKCDAIQGLQNADVRNMKNKDSQIDTIYFKTLKVASIFFLSFEQD